MVDDAYFEGEETIEVQGSAGDLDVTAASLTLDDDETAPMLELLGIPTAFISEGESDTATATVVVTGATFEKDTVFTLAHEDTDGASSSDFTYRD